MIVKKKVIYRILYGIRRAASEGSLGRMIDEYQTCDAVCSGMQRIPYKRPGISECWARITNMAGVLCGQPDLPAHRGIVAYEAAFKRQRE
jgi:hypothetical protein